MQRDTAPIWFICIVSAALVMFALATVGGPMQGAIERRDSTRMSDLNAVRSFVRCVSRETGTVPAKLEETAGCSPDRLEDPYSGEPYRYTVLQEDRAQICATFESPDTLTHHLATSIDEETGCIEVQAQRQTGS